MIRRRSQRRPRYLDEDGFEVRPPDRLLTEGRRQLCVVLQCDGTSQKALAKVLKVKPAMVSLLAAGLRRPGIDLAVLIEDAVGIPVKAWTIFLNVQDGTQQRAMPISGSVDLVAAALDRRSA